MKKTLMIAAALTAASVAALPAAAEGVHKGYGSRGSAEFSAGITTGAFVSGWDHGAYAAD